MHEFQMSKSQFALLALHLTRVDSAIHYIVDSVSNI